MENQQLYDVLYDILIELKQNGDEIKLQVNSLTEQSSALKEIVKALNYHSQKFENIEHAISKNNLQNAQNSLSILRINEYVPSITNHEERIKKIEDILQRKSA